MFPYMYYNPNPWALTQKYNILIELDKRILTLYTNGTVYKTYTVAIGKPSTPSPRGIFKIKNKAYNPGGPFGSRWMGLTAPGGSYGIHGTNNPSSIGNAASAGCIRMYNHDVIELYNLVSIGTVVEIK